MGLRQDLEGLRFRKPGDDRIYLIDDTGGKRWIPSQQVYENLFRDWCNIHPYVDIDEIDDSENGPLASDASLVKFALSDKVYLKEGSVLRWIYNGYVFDRYQFSWDKVVKHKKTLEMEMPFFTHIGHDITGTGRPD